jgi:hypothetical protein
MIDWLKPQLENQSPAELHYQLVFLFLGLLFLAWKIRRVYQQFRYIQDTPTSRIASAAQGYVELQGWGEYLPEGVITSPFSGRRCLWYHCRVEVRKRRGKRSYWVEESVDLSDDLFVIRDDSGDCVVMPDGAQVVPSQKRVWYGSSSQRRHQVPSDKQIPWMGWLGFGRYRFTEELILLADPLYIIGDFESVQKSIDPNTIQQQTRELLTYWKTQPQRFLKPFDRNHDNHLNRDEWRLASQQAQNEVWQRHQSPLIHTIRKPADTQQPFVISCLDEDDLQKKNRLYVVIYLSLFFILLYLFLNLLDFVSAL